MVSYERTGVFANKQASCKLSGPAIGSIEALQRRWKEASLTKHKIWWLENYVVVVGPSRLDF